jgi:hypothetical protein
MEKYIKTFEQFINESKLNEEADIEDMIEELKDAETVGDFVEEIIENFSFEDYEDDDYAKLSKLIKKYKLKESDIWMNYGDSDGAVEWADFIDDGEIKLITKEYIQIGEYEDGFELDSDGDYNTLLKKGKKIGNLGFANLFSVKIGKLGKSTIIVIEQEMEMGDRSVPENYDILIKQNDEDTIISYLEDLDESA